MQPSDPRLRRLALHAQGLDRQAPFGRGLGAAARALEHVGYFQIDTISVVARAHHHALWSRVPSASPAGDHLDRLVAQRKAFEYWFHAAAYLPMRDYRFALPRMRQYRQGKTGWHRGDPREMRRVLDRVRAEGPLRARDFVDRRAARGGWWDWSPAKQALERLFMQGDLMIAGREGFQKVYDLRERVLPPGIDVSEPSLVELADHLIDTALRAHGVAALGTILYQRRTPGLREAVRKRLDRRAASGEIAALELAGGHMMFMQPGALDRPMRSAARVKLLSPFDNAVIQRDRNVAIHEFDYQIECYLPAPKRRFGYFCLPVLYRDRLVGRADCKAHRKQGVLEVVHLHLERELAERERFAASLGEELHAFAAFNGCSAVRMKRVSPRGLRGELKRVLDATAG